MDPDLAQLVSDVRVESNFDVTDDQALRWLSRRHQTMCARSRCYRVLASGTIPAGTAEIPVTGVLTPTTVAGSLVEFMEFAVDGIPWGRVSYSTFLRAQSGTSLLSGSGGIWTNAEDANGSESVLLYPAPSEDFVATIRTAQVPPPFDATSHPSQSQIRVPQQFFDGLVDGAIATGLTRVEQRPDLAGPMDASFDRACEELRRHVNRQYRGSQPAQARVVGIDA